MKTYAELAIGTRVAAHVSQLAGWKVWKAHSAYTAPMDDRLVVTLEDPKYPASGTLTCVLKWPSDFAQTKTKFKIRQPEQAKKPLFKLKGRP